MWLQIWRKTANATNILRGGGGGGGAYFMVPGRNINTMFSEWYEYYKFVYYYGTFLKRSDFHTTRQVINLNANVLPSLKTSRGRLKIAAYLINGYY